MKLVLNRCYGGFSLSLKALLRCYELGLTEIATPVGKYFGASRKPDDPYGLQGSLKRWREEKDKPAKDRSPFVTVFTPDEQFVLRVHCSEHRAHPILVSVVEEMGDEASGDCAELAVTEIPDGIEWEIDEYDGIERVAESHRTWP